MENNAYEMSVLVKETHMLSAQAVTSSASVIRDNSVRASFLSSITLYGQSVINDVKRGSKSIDQAMNELLKEKRSLIEQAKEIAVHGVGAIAGAMQIAAGVGTCFIGGTFTAGALCFTAGSALMAHGANNVYENTWGAYVGDNEGPLREGYEKIAQTLGYSKGYGDVAYSTTDLVLSLYALSFKTAIKPPLNPTAPNARRFKLYYWSSQDFYRQIQIMGKLDLATEAGFDVFSLLALKDSIENKDKR